MDIDPKVLKTWFSWIGNTKALDEIDGKKTKFVGISGKKTETKTISLIDGIKYGISESYNISSISLRALTQIINNLLTLHLFIFFNLLLFTINYCK